MTMYASLALMSWIVGMILVSCGGSSSSSTGGSAIVGPPSLFPTASQTGSSVAATRFALTIPTGASANLVPLVNRILIQGESRDSSPRTLTTSSSFTTTSSTITDSTTVDQTVNQTVTATATNTDVFTTTSTAIATVAQTVTVPSTLTQTATVTPTTTATVTATQAAPTTALVTVTVPSVTDTVTVTAGGTQTVRGGPRVATLAPRQNTSRDVTLTATNTVTGTVTDTATATVTQTVSDVVTSTVTGTTTAQTTSTVLQTVTAPAVVQTVTVTPTTPLTPTATVTTGGETLTQTVTESSASDIQLPTTVTSATFSNPSGGSLTNTGVYTAGPHGNTADTVTYTASNGNTVTLTISVSPTLMLSPLASQVAPGAGLSFSALNNSGAVTFTMVVNQSGGSLDSSSGAYQAGNTANTVDIIQASDAAGNVAYATVIVGSVLTLTPSTATLSTTGQQAFQARGAVGISLFTLLVNESRGTVDALSGAYVAGATGGTDVVVAGDQSGNVGISTVTVHP